MKLIDPSELRGAQDKEQPADTQEHTVEQQQTADAPEDTGDFMQLLNDAGDEQPDAGGETQESVQQAQPVQQQQPQATSMYGLTADEMARYSQSIPTIEKVARAVASDVMLNVEARIAALEKKLDDALSKAAQATSQVREVNQAQFRARLAELVPDFGSVQRDQNFRAWLKQVNPLTGQTYESLIRDAIQRMDAQRVANIVSLWRQGDAGGPPGAMSPYGASTPAPNVSAGQRGLTEEDLLAWRAKYRFGQPASRGLSQKTIESIIGVFNAYLAQVRAGNKVSRQEVEQALKGAMGK